MSLPNDILAHRKALLASETKNRIEGKPIPKFDKDGTPYEIPAYPTYLEQNKKKETPKNDQYNEYDYSDDKDADDKQW